MEIVVEETISQRTNWGTVNKNTFLEKNKCPRNQHTHLISTNVMFFKLQSLPPVNLNLESLFHDHPRMLGSAPRYIHSDVTVWSIALIKCTGAALEFSATRWDVHCTDVVSTKWSIASMQACEVPGYFCRHFLGKKQLRYSVTMGCKIESERSTRCFPRIYLQRTV